MAWSIQEITSGADQGMYKLLDDDGRVLGIYERSEATQKATQHNGTTPDIGRSSPPAPASIHRAAADNANAKEGRDQAGQGSELSGHTTKSFIDVKPEQTKESAENMNANNIRGGDGAKNVVKPSNIKAGTDEVHSYASNIGNNNLQRGENELLKGTLDGEPSQYEYWSRMADRINNRRWGMGGATHYNHRTGQITNTTKYGSHDKITTEDMRKQDLYRALMEAATRQRAITIPGEEAGARIRLQENQGRTQQSLEQEQQQKRMQIQMQGEQNVLSVNLARANSARQLEAVINQFMSGIDPAIVTRDYNIGIAQMNQQLKDIGALIGAQSRYVWGQILAAAFGKSLPAPLQALAATSINKIINIMNGNMSIAEKQAAINQELSDYAAQNTNVEAAGLGGTSGTGEGMGR